MKSVWVAAFLCCLVPASLFGEEPSDQDLDTTIATLEKFGLKDFVASALACGCTEGKPARKKGCQMVVTQPSKCTGTCRELDFHGEVVKIKACSGFGRASRCVCPIVPAQGHTIDSSGCKMSLDVRECQGRCVDDTGGEIDGACGGDP